jgi:hypothetical protein
MEAFRGTDAAGRGERLVEGIKIARARRARMLDLIKTDPKTALEHAVPYHERKDLPPEILALLEELVSGNGRYDVIAVDHITDQGLRGETKRSFTLDGSTFSVSTYGRRSGTSTKLNLSGHGVALDGAMAMHESPVRELDSAERADLGLPTEGIAVEAYDRFLIVGDRDAVVRMVSEIEAGENKPNPFAKEPASLAAGTVKTRKTSGTESPTAQSPLDEGGEEAREGRLPNPYGPREPRPCCTFARGSRTKPMSR